MSSADQHAVIVGAGQAGSVVATTLRAEGFAGRITLLGAEPLAPYQRPPLSKALLLGAMAPADLLLRPLNFYAERNIDVRTGVVVASIDRVGARLHLGDGTGLSYDQLCLATGARPRHLPTDLGGARAGVLVLRNQADAAHLAAQLQPGRAVVIIGGGYIGLEVAATCIKRGLTVTILEAGQRILQRVAAPETSDIMRDLHAANGVRIIESCAPAEILGGSHVTGVRTATGEILPADLVVVAIGVVPETELAQAAGLTIDNGIAVDDHMRTSDPAIWAAGDCAAFVYRGRRQRIESVGNAIDTAEIAARGMLGQPASYVPAPWFWSDQYETRLQIAGHNQGYDAVYRRTSGAGISHWYYGAGTLLAVDAINDSRAYMVGKRLIEMHRSPPPDQLTDPAQDLKALLK